jgi:hypothetical protein
MGDRKSKVRVQAAGIMMPMQHEEIQDATGKFPPPEPFVVQHHTALEDASKDPDVIDVIPEKSDYMDEKFSSGLVR